MLLIDSLAEEEIRAAIRRGEFDDLPGQGQPLILADDSVVPDALRVGYRILKNAACLPAGIALRKEISELQVLLDLAELAREQQTIRRRLCLLKTRLALQGNDSNLLVREQAYRDRLIAKIAPAERDNNCTVSTQSISDATRGS